MQTVHFFQLLLHGIVVGILLQAGSFRATAQELIEGTPIRVFQQHENPQEGMLLRLGVDSLWYQPRESESVAALPLALIEHLEVRERASRTRGAWTWGKWAFLGGAVVGGVSCLVNPEPCRSESGEGTAAVVLESALFVGSGVGLIGAVGGTIFPGYRWRTVSSPYEVAVGTESFPGSAIRLVIRR